MVANKRQHGGRAEWKGVAPAIPTPVAEDGAINEPALRAIMEDNIAHGVHGFWVAGGTGEGALLTDEQRATVARISGEMCAGRVLDIMHVGAPTTESAVRAARAARESGCAAICCVPPFFYRPSESAIVEHYQRVADAADLPFFAYNLPQLTNVEIDPPLMERLVARVPQLTGLKHSALNISHIQAFDRMGLKVFTGNGSLLLPALCSGAIGVVDAPPGVAPWVYVDLFNAWQAGDMATALAKQRETWDIVNLVRMFGAAQHTVKLIFGRRTGLDCGEPIPPVNRLGEDEKAAVLERAGELGLLEAQAPVAAE